MNTSQTMNKFPPYTTSNCIPKFPKFPKQTKSLKYSRKKKQKVESSSSSEDEKVYSITKTSKHKQYNLLEYNESSNSDDCSNDNHTNKNCRPRYSKSNRGNDSTKDSCHSLKNECMQCCKDCCNSMKSDCTTCKYLQGEKTKRTMKSHFNNDMACNSCCGHNDDYNDIGSTINHYRSNNLLTNSRLLPRRYPPSWTPLQARSSSPLEKVANGACTIQECDDHDECNNEIYEGDCNVIRGGVTQRSTTSHSQTSDVSFLHKIYLRN